MLKKRIIPCLDIQNGKTVKGVNFKNIINAGDPVELAIRYEEEGADELVLLDITATIEKRKTFYQLVEQIAKNISIPFTVGGGIAELDDVKKLIQSGADKISINSSAVKNPGLITAFAKEVGSQCVVVAIDTNYINNDWFVYTHGGRKATEIKTTDWAKNVEQLGAGEILLTSMNNDGTKSGFAIDITKKVCELVNIPVIASGGAGSMRDFEEVFTKTKASGALAASIFHFNEIAINQLKQYLKNKNIPIR